MAKITTSELEEMIRKNLINKGLNEIEINEEDIRNISNKIKKEVNKGIQPKEEEESEIVNVDISKSEDEEGDSLGNSKAITYSQDSDEIYKKEAELKGKEKYLSEKEAELKRKEEELAIKEKELEYKPEMPKALEDMGSEKLFVFDMSKLSSGAENLSRLSMNLMNNPEEKTTIKDLWLDKAKKKSEVYVVKFEKVGEIDFDPIEGTSNLTTIKDVNGDKEITNFQNDTNPDLKDSTPTNMTDVIAPIRDVTQPMSDDMGLNMSNGKRIGLENLPKEEYNEVLKNTVEDLIKKYLHGKIELEKNA
tara:strand:- start:11320 stop:12234 length:915 start_codon:yes stop_codon:yes gene_type:complete